MENIPGLLGTTSMGILPHVDEHRALDLALSMDIPFWPQLPLKDFRDDMWVQFSRNFPGIVIDWANKRLRFDTEKFYQEFEEYSIHIEDLDFFEIKKEHSLLFHKFLEKDLSNYQAIRGQVTGPLNLGFRILDEQNRPIIYHDDIRELLFDYVKKKIIWQFNKLKSKNKNSFVWIDEPAVAWTFSSFSGYTEAQAKYDLKKFFSSLPKPRGLHLCINVDMDFLTSLDIEILSIKAYQMEILPHAAARSLAKFLEKNKIICWGIVPTVSVFLDQETPEKLSKKLLSYMEAVANSGSISIKEVAEKSLIAPARCCLKNADLTDLKKNPHYKILKISQGVEQELMEKAIEFTLEISKILKNRFDF